MCRLEIGSVFKAMKTQMDKFGALGSWEKIEETFDATIVKQVNDGSCVSAVGEMLAKNYGLQINQQEILENIGEWSNAESLARFLNSKETQNDIIWEGGGWNFETPIGALKWLLNNHKIGGFLFDESTKGHAVLVDGLDNGDLVVIKDPDDQTVYKMQIESFLEVFAFFVWRKSL